MHKTKNTHLLVERELHRKAKQLNIGLAASAIREIRKDTDKRIEAIMLKADRYRNAAGRMYVNNRDISLSLEDLGHDKHN